jgi:Cu(I)/Ag(I) efflux system membrane fusion protein
MMRNVSLGPGLGDSFIIKSGLEEGEEIAVNGTFSIDAAAQLAGKPSMMNPEGGPAMTGHNHGGGSKKMDATTEVTSMKVSNNEIEIDEKAKNSLIPLFESYFSLKDALTEDDFERSKKDLKKLSESINQVNMKLFKGKSHKSWMTLSSKLKTNVEIAEKTTQIDEVRNSFIVISKAIIQLNETFQPLNYPAYVQHCPMANNNKGADWLSKDKEIKNPYFGNSMQSCGELKK